MRKCVQGTKVKRDVGKLYVCMHAGEVLGSWLLPLAAWLATSSSSTGFGLAVWNHSSSWPAGLCTLLARLHVGAGACSRVWSDWRAHGSRQAGGVSYEAWSVIGPGQRADASWGRAKRAACGARQQQRSSPTYCELADQWPGIAVGIIGMLLLRAARSC